LTGLVKQLEASVEKNTDKKLCVFVVVLTDDADATAKKLEALAEKENVNNVPLTLVEGNAGPPEYKIAKDAEVTVMLWKGQQVQANHAFRKNELHKKQIDAVMADVAKLVE
jgi:hypothetical protein